MTTTEHTRQSGRLFQAGSLKTTRSFGHWYLHKLWPVLINTPLQRGVRARRSLFNPFKGLSHPPGRCITCVDTNGFSRVPRPCMDEFSTVSTVYHFVLLYTRRSNKDAMCRVWRGI